MKIEELLKNFTVLEDEKTFEFKERVLKNRNEEKALHDVI